MEVVRRCPWRDLTTENMGKSHEKYDVYIYLGKLSHEYLMNIPLLYIYILYIYMVDGFNHLENYEFVNGKDDIPYMKWKIIQPCSKPPTR